ncbi:ATP-grasp peptide maturase system methyltransferase [Kribbella sp. NPDC056861]|uniref:ATP-grasp peptide maturase system methyltransferase n=1 Tax=Kribbella sp. NPDC056861 TaxID=3154857 RepID=UPI003443F508
MTPDEVARHASGLRHQLAVRLELDGHIRTPGWREAVEGVPRHEFIPEFFVRVDPASGPTLWDPTSADLSTPDRWLALAYQDASQVTQLDGKTTPSDVTGLVEGNPTSSSTMPSLVVRMWEDLEVEDGDRVLEIGTGTGYSTALGCHRLGADNITSVEFDSEVADRAQQALARAGYRPHLILGDGEKGLSGGAPYDRIIATCSFRYVPQTWLAQSKPGTIILVTLSGWLGGTGLVKLTVTGDGTAEGQFLPGYVSFMPSRAHYPEPAVIPDLADGSIPRPTSVGPDAVATYGPAQLVAQLAIPEAQYLQLGSDDDKPDHVIIQPDGSYAAFTGKPGAWAVQQGGPQKFWDAVEAALTDWSEAGEPPIEQFQVSVTPQAQVVRFHRSPTTWRLPSPSELH